MAALDLTTLTFYPESVQSASELIAHEAFLSSNLRVLHNVQEGIANNKQVGFVPTRLIGGLALGACGSTTEGAAYSPIQRTWTPIITGQKYTLCASDLVALENKYTGKDCVDLMEYLGITSKEIADQIMLITGLLSSEIMNSALTKAWFNDSAAASITSGGNFSAGVNLGYFNQGDGLFKQIESGVTTPLIGQGLIKKASIAENAAVTVPAQALGAGRGLAILDEVYSQSSEILKGTGGKYFYVTGSIYDALLKDYRTLTANGTIEYLSDIKTLTYLGIEVKRLSFWDSVTAGYQTAAGGLKKTPHRVVLTTPENIPFGTSSLSNLDNIAVHTDADLKRNNQIQFEYIYTMDCKLMMTDLISVAY